MPILVETPLKNSSKSEVIVTELRGLAAFEAVKRLIVIAAHPDDLETMCGGLIYKLAQQGVKIFSVNCTLGDIGAQEANIIRPALAAARIAETEEAARILGIEQTYNLGRPDGELVADLELRAQIARLYRITQADTLLTFDPFWTGQIHPDHRAAGQAALDAYMPSKMPLYRPEQLNENGTGLGRLERIFFFSTSRDPEIFVDVADVYETKLAACLAHVSQFPKGEESMDWLKELDREKGQAINATYAEAFKQIQVW
jgi:LmbE family N-acetylglucosaminyl deacetylase